MIRLLDFFLSLTFIIVFSPLFFILSLLIIFTSGLPFLYSQVRVGLHGKDFKIYKFRTMNPDAEKRGSLTLGIRDPRITPIGYFLRKYKFDELPQLFNVLKGEMSIVGPRPEVRKYVDLYFSEQAKILNVKPGITDWASIMYLDENIILSKSSNPEKDYIEIVLPDKIRHNMIYINNYRAIEYLRIIFVTLRRILFPKKSDITHKYLPEQMPK